jgi:phytoene/squalene synthetase
MTTAAPQNNREILEQGFRNARSAVRSCFRDGLWATGNMPVETRKELDALGSHLVRCLDLLELESTEGLPLDIWKEIRDELGDALCGKFQTAEQAALAFVVDRHKVPKQFLFDMVNAADYWIRFRKFDSWEQLDTFASNLGGSAMVAAAKIVGAKPGYEEVALECGKAIFLTQRLANCVSDLKANRNFLAQEDMDRFGLEVHRIKMKQACPEFKRFVRFYIARLEKLYRVGAELVSDLEFDGARSLTSLLSVNWRMLTRMRMQPESLFHPDGVLSRRDWIALKSRHVLGLEGGIPILDQSVDRH